MIEEHFAKKIKELRLERGITQAQLGAQLGLSQRKVSKLETLQLIASPQIIVTYADYFDVSADYLLGRTEI